MSTIDDIAKLKELLDQGAITQEEYDAQKAKLFAEESPAGQAAPGSGPDPQPYQQQYGQQQQYQQSAPPPYGGAAAGHMPGTPYSSYQEDAQVNKVFGILAYIGFLCFVSMLAAPKESGYSRFHTNQGLVLFIFEIAGSIVLNIASAAAGISFGLAIGVGFGAVILLGIISFVYGAGMILLAILGIINAVKGDHKPLPVIGGIQILK